MRRIPKFRNLLYFQGSESHSVFVVPIQQLQTKKDKPTKENYSTTFSILDQESGCFEKKDSQNSPRNR